MGGRCYKAGVIIACEKCATSYVLEDRLVPPGGAPVQCTRCNHVFVAYPQKSAPGAPSIEQNPSVAPGQELPRNKTMIFGAPVDRPESAASPLQQELHPAFSPEAPGAKTMMFGSVSAPPPQQELHAAFSPEAARMKTMLFGSVSRPPQPDAAQPSAMERPFVGRTMGPTDPEAQQDYRSAAVGQTHGPPTASGLATERVKETAPELSSSKHKAQVVKIDLPPEPLAIGASHEADDPADQFRRQIRRRNRIALFAIIGLLLVITSAAAAHWAMKRLPRVPETAVQAQEAALALLRKDDGASKRQAIEQLGALARQHPTYLEGKAALVVALSLEVDDARIEIKRLTARSEALHKEVARLKERQKPDDWQARANALIDQIAAIKQQQDPLIDALQRLDGELNAAFKSLASSGDRSAEANLALVRAQAVYYGIKGSDQAIALSERYRLLRPEQDDGWGAVAFAEYAINARVAPDTLKQALAGLEALRQRDSTFLRTYTLAARLLIAQKRHSAALDELDAVLLLNPEHDVAKRLRDWARELEQTEKENAAPKSP